MQVEREYRVLAALQATPVPVPRVVRLGMACGVPALMLHVCWSAAHLQMQVEYHLPSATAPPRCLCGDPSAILPTAFRSR